MVSDEFPIGEKRNVVTAYVDSPGVNPIHHATLPGTDPVPGCAASLPDYIPPW